MAQETIITELNMKKICRVCLEEGEEMHSVFSELAHEEDSEESLCVYEILMNVSNIKVLTDDSLPDLICASCLELAQSSYKFQQKCNRSQEVLEAYLTSLPAVTITESATVIKTDDGDYNFLLDFTADKNLESSSDEDEPQIQDCNVVINEESDNGNNEEILVNLDPSEISLTEENVKMHERLTVKKKQKQQEDGDDKANCKFKYFTKINENGDKIYVCNLCDKTYKNSNGLRMHMRTHTEERPYVCNLCNKAFSQFTSLTYHLRSHSGAQPYACKICGKRYRQSGTLTAHMRVHTGHRPFLCSICGKGFRQAPDLNYHMRTHTKEKPYMCNVCGKTMAMQCHLVQHMRIHTGERPFKCEHCTKAFPSSTRLKRHAIIHTGLKPYTCEVCNKSFNRASSLSVHSKIHTDERSFVCPVCGKRFIQAHTLKGHVVTHSTTTSNNYTAA